MPDLDERLSAIFRVAFPGLNEGTVRHATRDSVAGWDSVATVTLFSLLEEEFGEQLDLEDAAEWASYAQVRAALEKRLGG
jgi:acyl carrier protein